MSTSERTIHTPRANMRVRVTSGTGMPLVLLHGSGASGAAFRRQMDGPLGEIWRMIAIDLPGHGGSDDARDPARDYTITGLSSIVGDAIDELGIGRFALLGWSLGGHIAIELMAERHDVAGVMLCGTPPLGRGPIASLRAYRATIDILLGSKERYTERDAQRLLHLCYGNTSDLGFIADIRRADGRLRATVIPSLLRGNGVDQKRAVEHATVPIAMVNGANEPMARLSYIDGLDYQTLWEDRCFIIDGVGHSPFWQAPERFNVFLHRFLTSISHSATQPAERRDVAENEDLRAG